MKRKDLFEEIDCRINELDALRLSLEGRLQDVQLKTRILLECKINKVLVSGIVNSTIKIDYGYEGFTHGYFYSTHSPYSGFVILGDRLKDIDKMAEFMESITLKGKILEKHPNPVNLSIIGKTFDYENITYAAEFIYPELISTGEMQYMCRKISGTGQAQFVGFRECDIIERLESQQLDNKKHQPFSSAIEAFSKAEKAMDEMDELANRTLPANPILYAQLTHKGGVIDLSNF